MTDAVTWSGRIAVIGGGENCEHDVSLASAASVCATLAASGFDVVPITISPDGVWERDGHPLAVGRAASVAAGVQLLAACDVVVPMVHGPRGEDGTLAALCTLAGVPFVGSGVRAGAIGMDKWATKAAAAAIGIRTAPGVLLHQPAARFDRYPAVVKPVAAGSSHGVAIARNDREFADAVLDAFALDAAVLVEEFVSGREIDIAVLRLPDGTLRVSPPIEIVLDSGTLFDTAVKYDGTAQFRLPAAVTDAELAAVTDAATRLYEALGCAGVARVDFFLTDEGPVLNEINTTPGFTAASQVPRMFAAGGLPYAALLASLVHGALLDADRGQKSAIRAESQHTV